MTKFNDRQHDLSASSKSSRVKWTYQVNRSAEEGLVFAWLLEQTGDKAPKELANEAVKAFYLALAHQDAYFDGAASRTIAQKSVWTLLHQIMFLGEEFDLDLTPVVAALSCSDQVNRSKFAPSAPSDFSYPSHLETTAVPNSILEEIGYGDDDEGDVFEQLR